VTPRFRTPLERELATPGGRAAVVRPSPEGRSAR
jgi:hypothetical protein